MFKISSPKLMGLGLLLSLISQNVSALENKNYADISSSVSDEKTEEKKSTITQEELKRKIDAFGIAKDFVNFAETDLGITFNGKLLRDADGIIKQVTYDPKSGFITYILEKKDNSFAVKFMQATSHLQPIVIARANLEYGSWVIATITGESFSGSNLHIGSNGFVVPSPEEMVYVFDYYKGLNSVNIPQGYKVAEFQSGDILGSKIILLEIPKVAEKTGSMSSLFGNIKALGSMLGMAKKEDYAFLDLSSSKLTKINIPNNPTKSMKPYHLRITWFKTSSGAIALTQEDDLGKIYATNLSTGKKVLLKKYLPGYVAFDAFIQSNGKLKLSAKKGMFGSDDSEDVEAEIINLPAIVEEESK